MNENDAKELFRIGKYNEAFSMYEKLWNDSSENDIWVGWGLARTLNKLKKYDQSLVVCKKVLELKSDFNYIRSVYIQAAYLSKIKDYNFDNSYEVLEQYIKRIININSDNKTDLFFNLSLIKIMEYCSKNKMWDMVIKWGELINIEELNNKPFITDNKIYIASDKESWFLKISQAFEKKNLWDECIVNSRKGLSLFKDSPQSIWLKIRIAISEYYIESKEKGIESLINCYSIKKDWFIAHKIGQLFSENNNINMAEKYFVEACIKTQKKPDFGVKLYEDLSIFYESKKDIEMSKKYLSLTLIIREENGWKINENLMIKAKKLHIELNIDKKEILKDLKNIWEKINTTYNPRYIGYIKTILPNGKSGFLTSENNKDYFFSFKGFVDSKIINPMKGNKVSFIVEKSFDRKKNQDSYIANQIKIEI